MNGWPRVLHFPPADEILAIKAVDASRFRSITEVEQVQEETHVLSGLKHPNIIRLTEVRPCWSNTMERIMFSLSCCNARTPAGVVAVVLGRWAQWLAAMTWILYNQKVPAAHGLMDLPQTASIGVRLTPN